MPSAAEPFLLATRSAGKLRELGRILTGVRLITLDDAGVPPTEEEDGIEDANSFLGNAHAKAGWFHARTGLPTLADDSGICIHALGGAPGVRSRRFAADAGARREGEDEDVANNRHLLARLAGVSPEKRTAHYACAAVLHRSGAPPLSAIGTCAGVILHAPRGAGGFGYDPLFLEPASARTFGELGAEEKDRISHRARAFRALFAQLK